MDALLTTNKLLTLKKTVKIDRLLLLQQTEVKCSTATQAVSISQHIYAAHVSFSEPPAYQVS